MATVYPIAHMEAASIAGRDPIMDRTANRVLATAKRIAAKHRDTGNYIDKLGIETARKGKDRLIVADDPAAVPIEFGHIVVTRIGARRVKATYVPGLRIMRDTYAAVTK